MTGTTSGALDLVLLIILVEIFHIYYLLGATITFIATHSLAYFINMRWGFKDSTAQKMVGYYYFIFFGVIGIFLTIFLLRLSVETFKIHYIPSKILVGIITGIFNFSMNYLFTFKMKKTKWIRKK